MLMFTRRIHEKVRRVTRTEFDADEDLQLALTHLIQIIGEAASRTSPSLRSTYPQVPWTQVIGMRHRIVHDYLRIRTDVVWETAMHDIPPLIQILEPLIPDEPPEESA